MALGPKQMEEAIFRNLEKNSGKTLDEWLVLLDKSNIKGIKEQNVWLKKQGLGSVQAMFIVNKFNHIESIYEDSDKLVDDLFAKFAEQKKLYNQLLNKLKTLVKDISIRHCKTYVPLYKKNQFLTIKPSKNGLVLGFPFREKPKSQRLKPADNNTGGSERINFMTIINSNREIDNELLSLIKSVYAEN